MSKLGVPVGVLFALSMRLCLEPDLGVTLPFRNAATGDATSSLTVAGPLPRADSALCTRLGSGVVTVTVWCCGVEDRVVAILGVRGALLAAPLAAAALRGGIWGCLDCVADPFSGGIFGVARVTDMKCFEFRERVGRATTLLSRGRSTGPEYARGAILADDDVVMFAVVLVGVVAAIVVVAVIRGLALAVALAALTLGFFC